MVKEERFHYVEDEMSRAPVSNHAGDLHGRVDVLADGKERRRHGTDFIG